MKPTGFERYTQNQLHSLFSTNSWSQLSFDERINACQEIANRYAAEHNVAACTVTHEQMNGASYGWQNSNTICLNTSLVRDGVFVTSYQDSSGQMHQAETPALAPGWNTLDTVYHEGTHGIQEASGQIPSTYISPDMDSDLYRIQGIEKEAYAVAQSRTLNALSETERISGNYDPGRSEYFASVKNDSFQAALQDAMQHYHDPNIESTLQSVISDRENGITPDNPSPSYQAINNLCDSYGIHHSSSIESTQAFQTADDGISSYLSNSEETSATSSSELDDGISQESSPDMSSGGYTDDGMDSDSSGMSMD